jgi:hypothetical protein
LGRIRAYFKLDLYFFEHPKVVDLSHSATVLYIASIAYANRRETDGFIARPVLRRLIELDLADPDCPTHDGLAAELVRAGLWVEVPARPGSVRPDTEPRPPDGPGGWRIHDFLDHNDSNEDRAKRRADDAARKRGERGGKGSEPAGQGTAKGRPANVHPDTSGRPAGPETLSARVRPITEQSSNREEQKGSPPSLPLQADASEGCKNDNQKNRTEGKGKAPTPGRPPRVPRHPTDDFVVQRARQIQAEDGPEAARAYLRKVGENYGQADRDDQLRRLEEAMTPQERAQLRGTP